MTLTYLGFCIPEDLLDEVQNDGVTNSVQTTRFAEKFLKSISPHCDVFNISCPSVVEFPVSNKFFTRGSRFTSCCQSNIVFPLINIFLIKHLLQIICPLALIIKRPSDQYVCHGLNLSYIVVLCLVKLVTRSPICILLTDPPVSKAPLDSAGKCLFRKMYIALIGFFIKYFDGMIALSPAFRDLFRYEGKFIYIEGVYN